MRGARGLALATGFAATMAVVLSAAGCKRSHAGAVDGGRADAPTPVKADSQGLLLTWIDDKGDFHVETRVADVPMMGRDSVRVVDPNKEEGTHPDRVYVVDLRSPAPDGTFPVRTMTRAAFEAIAVARRDKAGPTLASAASSATPSSSGSRAGTGDAPSSAAVPPAHAAVILYGASWCSACHKAERYLKSKGVPYVDKDIEKDPGAAREMQEKLARNRLPSGSIPVIDVRGKVMVGFDPQAIDSALGEAL